MKRCEVYTARATAHVFILIQQTISLFAGAVVVVAIVVSQTLTPYSINNHVKKNIFCQFSPFKGAIRLITRTGEARNV